MERIYLDHAATTPVAPEVLDAMLPFLTKSFGNASSIHSFGQDARSAVEQARKEIASLISARPEEIVFTSGGTESDNFILKGVAQVFRNNGNHIITSAIEHHAVLETCSFLEEQGFEVTYLPVNGYGLVDPGEVENAITGRTILISVMHGNNEIGTIEPITEIGAIAHHHGIYFHTDAVQTFGHVPIDVNAMNVDLLSASAHKIYGPKGTGMAYIRKGVRIAPLLHGGDQERMLRASTLNVPGIVGFGHAAACAKKEMPSEQKRLTKLRDRLAGELLARLEDCFLNGHPESRLPNNVNVTIPSAEGESMLLCLDMEGIAVSTGSACTSSRLEPSHVLTAVGLSRELAQRTLRFSMGRTTTDAHIDRLVDILPGIVEKLRTMSPFTRKGEQ